MALGLRDQAVNEAAKRQLWRGLVPFDQLPPGPEPEFADENPVTAAERLRNGRLIDRALADAIATGDRAAIREATRPPAGPRGAGVMWTLTGGSNTGSVGRNLSWGPFSSPFIIRQIVLSASRAVGAPSGDMRGVELVLTGEDRTNLIPRPTGARVWPRDPSNNDPGLLVAMLDNKEQVIDLRPNAPVDPGGLFLTFFIDDFAAGGGGFMFTVAITCEDLHLSGAGITSDALTSFALGRRYVGGAVPPAPRTPARSTPVGFTFNVSQGGRLLFSRTVPYSASAAAQAGYNPVNGSASPNVTVHTSEASWSNAFEQERARRAF